MQTFTAILQGHYQNRPDQPALILQHAGQPDCPLTYRALLSGANAYAQAFSQAGLRPGEVVVLILQHSQDLVSAFFGAILQGLVPSIMPYLTEKLLPERYRADLAALVEVTQPAAIVTYPEFEGEVRAALGAGSSVRAVLSTAAVPPAGEPDFERLPGLGRSPDDIVLLQHSSGTTGLQKGVALSHRGGAQPGGDLSRARCT